MNELESRYRRLFAAYPSEFRAAREDEMVATLLDVSQPGQQRPDVREAAAIVWAGARCRFRSADELRHGLQLAGVIAVGLVCMLGVAALSVTALPPIGASVTSQVLGWAAVAVALCIGCRTRWTHYRVVPPVVVSVLLLVGGSQLMGMRRPVHADTE